MGFSYSQFGLCCDFCGESKPEFNVKKIHCPYGYCQAWACCKNCKAKKLHLVCSIGSTTKTHKEICKDAICKYISSGNNSQCYLLKDHNGPHYCKDGNQ